MPRKHDGYLTLADAARRFGISHASAAKRIERGTLPAIKRGGRWYVHLDNLDTDPDDNPDTGIGTKPDGTTTNIDAVIAAKNQTIAAHVAELVHLRETNDNLLRQLAAERERSDTIQQMALLRIEALTAGEVETNDTSQDQRTAPTTAPGREEPPAMTPNTLHEPSVVTSWWRRLFGRS